MMSIDSLSVDALGKGDAVDTVRRANAEWAVEKWAERLKRSTPRRHWPKRSMPKCND